MLRRLMRWGRVLRKDAVVLWYAFRDPATPLWLKAASLLLVGYGISPVDLIPDVIPVFGLLDDAVILPAGVMLLMRCLPAQVRARSEEQASLRHHQGRKALRVATVVIVIWLALLLALIIHALQ